MSGKFRQQLWCVLENAPPSRLGRGFSLFSFGVLCAFILVVICFSYPRFQPPNSHFFVASNHTEISDYLQRIQSIWTAYDVCVIWFTVEFLIRLYAAPNRKRFILQPISLLDGFSLAFLVTVEVMLRLNVRAAFSKIKTLFSILVTLRMLQILRHASRIRSFRLLQATLLGAMFATWAVTLVAFGKINSYYAGATAELTFLFGLVCGTVLIVGTIMWAAESEVEGSSFQDIPSAMYWCIVTISSVGYGDLVPKGPVGRLVAGVTAGVGVLFVALPISIIVSDFGKAYATFERTEREMGQLQKNLDIHKNSFLIHTYSPETITKRRRMSV